MASKYLISSRQYRVYTSVHLVSLVAFLYCLAKNDTGQDRNIAAKFVLTAWSLTNNSYRIKNVYYKIVYLYNEPRPLTNLAFTSSLLDHTARLNYSGVLVGQTVAVYKKIWEDGTSTVPKHPSDRPPWRTRVGTRPPNSVRLGIRVPFHTYKPRSQLNFTRCTYFQQRRDLSSSYKYTLQFLA